MRTRFKPLPVGVSPLGEGFHANIPAKRYHADELCEMPTLSSSIATELATRAPSRARLQHPRLSEATAEMSEATAEMNFGSVVHELSLGRGGGFEVWSGETWRGKEAAAFWDAAVASGKTPIKSADMIRAELCVQAMRIQLKAMGLEYVLDEGESEAIAIWKHGDHWMRAMFDKWFHTRREVWDIKTTSKSAHPEQISRHIAQMNYDLRSEFYLMGAEKLTGMPSGRGGLGYQFLFVETTAPYLVTPCYLDESFKRRGRDNARAAMDAWARCMDSGEWPGYATGPVEIQAPGWVDFEIEEDAITASGEKVL